MALDANVNDVFWARVLVPVFVLTNFLREI